MEASDCPPNKWIVSGSSGFLGTEVCTLMHSLEYEVIGIDKIHPTYSPTWNTIVSDFTNYNEYIKLQKNKKFGVIHCAALKTVLDSKLNEDEFISNNVEKSILFFRSAHKAGCRNFIFISSAAVYSESKINISETHQTIPKSVYGQSKFSFEKHLREEKAYLDSSVVILRPFNIIGRNSMGMTSNSVITRILNCISNGSRFELRIGPSNQTPVRDYVDVKDVARLITLVVELQKPGIEVLNACTGRGVNLSTLIDMCEMIKSKKLHSEKETLGKMEILNSIGSPSLAYRKYGWKAELSTEESIQHEDSSA